MTFGIIGVVSAMTVPTLMQSYQRKSYVTQLHKVYNELQQAAQQYMTDRNAVNLREAGLTSTEALDNFVKTYFNVINECGAEQQPCFATSYKKISGTNMGQGTGQPLNYTIASGASFAVGVSSAGAGENNKVALFDIDINGPQGPNIAGRDVFILGLVNN